ncbi:MAG TPA: GAF domain-containing SpoIIE family protein phosphatase [Terracidiphilus sp.]
MAGLNLRAVLGSRSASMQVVGQLCQALAPDTFIQDASGRVLLGQSHNGSAAHSILSSDAVIGSVHGAHADVVAALLSHLADRESQQRALASETLTLYREMHLIEQLSEELAALLNISAISESSLAQARRLIPATEGAVFVSRDLDGPLEECARFGSAAAMALQPESKFIASVLERGVAEIVNNCSEDPRAESAERQLSSLLLAPLRTGQATVGAIVLAQSGSAEPYSAANLKLLNTIALQTATAIRNAVSCAQMVETARARAAYAAELQAASSVQQMLMQGASRPTPGFTVESVYLPASEVGGDFFFVLPARDGSLLATVGDVSGKGLTAAMRVSMILGVLRREVSDDPAQILFNLNNALVDQGQLGFTTACTVRIRTDGTYSFANAGHIAPYLSGVELPTAPALPLGIVPDQIYAPVEGMMQPRDRMVLVSDGVPEARSEADGLLGFERLAELSTKPAEQIADAARAFGQEDDITVVALQLAETGL